VKIIVKAKVLLLSYYFPPSRTSACARIVGFAKNLKELGYSPLIYTVKNPKDRWGVTSLDEEIPRDLEIIRSTELDLTRVVDFLDMIVNKTIQLFNSKKYRFFFRNNFCIPDPQIAWNVIFSARKYAISSSCIFVTCSPFSSAVLATVLKKMCKKPLITDFRDAWTLNPYVLRKSRFSIFINNLLESWVVRNTDKLILNTPGALNLYKEKYKKYSFKMLCIPNGYDYLPCKYTERNANEKFIIMHVGTFYGSRNPKLLLDALIELNLPDVKFIQIGDGIEFLNEYNGRIDMEVIKPIPNKDAVKMMCTASLLYLKQGVEVNIRNYIAIAAKTYEYIASGVPILAECPEGDNLEIIKNYANNRYLVSENEIEIMRDQIMCAYNNRSLKQTMPEAFVKEFDRMELTRRLASIIEEVIM